MNVGSRQLLVFLEICRLQSFAKAAESIPMSPSGVSMLVKELEDQIGARLFERTPRSVTLTEAGQRLLPVAERIVGELRSIKDVIGGREAAIRSRLNVAATPMVSAALLAGIMRAFAAAHPHVRLGLDDVDLNTVRRKVMDDEADLGLGFFVKPAAGLDRTALCSFRLMLISPPGVQAAGLGPDQPWSSLNGVPLVSLPSDNPIQVLIEKHLSRLQSPAERQRVNLIGTLIAMVQASNGHAVVPSFALDECLRRQLPVALLVEPAVHLDLFVLKRRGAQVKPAAMAFAAALKNAMTGLASDSTTVKSGRQGVQARCHKGG